MKKFSKNATLLLLCLLLNGITSTFIYTYLLAFILDVSNNGIVNVAFFYLVLHITMIILSWIMAPIFKKFNSSLSLKLGIVFKFLFVITVVFLNEKIINYVYLIAIFNGFSEVMFWGGANPLQFSVNQNNSISIYMSTTKILSTIIGFIVPIIMGYCIDEMGMSIISIAMTILVVIQLSIAMFINEKTPRDNRKLKYKKFIADVKSNFPTAKNIYLNLFLYGFCTNVSMLILYYTVITFGSNVSIGIFSTIVSILSIILLSLYNYKKHLFNTLTGAIISSILVSFSIVFILINLNRVSLTLFYIFWNISIIVPEIITGSTRLNITKQKKLSRYNVENVTISETYLDLGRVVGEVMLLIMGLVNNRIFDIICLCFTTIVVSFYLIHLVKLKDEITKTNKAISSEKNPIVNE